MISGFPKPWNPLFIYLFYYTRMVQNIQEKPHPCIRIGGPEACIGGPVAFWLEHTGNRCSLKGGFNNLFAKAIN